MASLTRLGGPLRKGECSRASVSARTSSALLLLPLGCP